MRGTVVGAVPVCCQRSDGDFQTEGPSAWKSERDQKSGYLLLFGLTGTRGDFPGRIGNLIGTLDDGGQLINLLRRQVDLTPQENENEEEEKEVDYPDYSDYFHTQNLTGHMQTA